jgi:elongation factor G
VALDSSETAFYIFKTMSEAHFGELSFFRVYSGSISTGKDLFNSDRKVSERIGQIYLLNGQTRVAVNHARRPATSARWSSSRTRTPATRFAPPKIP